MYKYNLSFIAGTPIASITEFESEIPMQVGETIMIYNDRKSYKIVDILHYMDDHKTVHTLVCEEV